MKNILLPTDFSENSWNAIKYALNFFKDEVCDFYLLNTYTPVVYELEFSPFGSIQPGIMDTMKESSEKGLEKMHEKIEKEFKNPKHTFAQISSYNALVDEIKELYESNNIDFIVMGTKGAKGAQEILFGSNTVHVFKNARCPVLAIPSKFSFETPHEILFPSDYGVDFQEEHLKPILDIAMSYHSRINIINVTDGYDLTEGQKQNKKKLDTYFKSVAHLFHSAFSHDVAEAIDQFQLKTRINLLVMINNKHSFFEKLFFKSTINQIGFHLNVPFLVIPSKMS